MCNGEPAKVRGLYLKMDEGEILQLFDNFDETGLSSTDEPARNCRLGRSL